jgi:hypothetical protein
MENTTETKQEEQPKKILPAKKKSLLSAAMVKCQSLINAVGKSGENKFDHYNYSTLEDYCKQLKPAMVAAELAVFFNEDEIQEKGVRETSTGKKEYVVRVKLTATIMHSSGECMDVVGWGEGQDRGDKAIYKAITGCKKYLLANAFNIPTTDDPEVDSHDADEPKKASKPTPPPAQPPKQAEKAPQKPVEPPKAPVTSKDPTDAEQSAKGLIIAAQVLILKALAIKHKVENFKWKAWLVKNYGIDTMWNLKATDFDGVKFTLETNVDEIRQFETSDDVAH